MEVETVTRSALGNAVKREVGISRAEALLLIETLFESISESLRRGETVKISGIGTFTLRHKGSRMGRNPKSGEAVEISPRRVVIFRASQVLKQKMLEGTRSS